MEPFIKRGMVWPWVTLIQPPEGWAFLTGHERFRMFYPVGIVALRDHDAPPIFPERFMPKTVETDV